MRTLGERRTSRPVKLDVRRLRIRLHLATNDREAGREPSDCLGCEIRVQFGCNKNSGGFLGAPKVAIGAVKLQPVTSGRWAVTAEVASSSLVVPAIHSKRVAPISLKPRRVQKGAILHPFSSIRTVFHELGFHRFDHSYASSFQNRRRAQGPLLARHALLARLPACKHPAWTVRRNAAATPASL